MKQVVSYDDDEITSIKKECADTIADFGEQFYIIREIYNALGLCYPKESHTNYRDAWFHYRKLYSQKDIISIINEKYGLEEHLLRAAKDAQIFLLQQLGSWLEVWYRHEEYLQLDEEKVKYKDSLFRKEGNWVLPIWKMYEKDQEVFANTCLWYYQKYIFTEDLKLKLQDLIHSIKNLILDLRLGGVNIYRPSDNVYYMKQCVDVYNKMCKSLKETRILYLISTTDTIRCFCTKKD